MVIHIILFIGYALLCIYGIRKLPFFRRSGIKPGVLIFLFALHVLTGCIHDLIAWRYYPGHGDIWRYFDLSLQDRRELFENFHQFLAENVFSDYASHNVIEMIHLLLNIFSLDNLYVNTLLFSFPVFIGTISLYKVFRLRYPDSLLPAACIFLLPSTLFWTSCVHREGLLYMLIGFLLPGLHRLLTRGYHRGLIIRSLLLFLMIAYVRDVVALLLIPAIFFWVLAEKPRARRPLLLAAGATLAVALLLILLMPGQTIPEVIARRQAQFLQLAGHSRLFLPPLDASWRSLLSELPAAILNGWFEPLPGSGGQPIYLVFSIELLLIWLVAAIALIPRHLPYRPLQIPPFGPAFPFGLFSLVFAFTGMLSIGMIVPFAGGIIRYRSIYLPFLLTPFLHSLCGLLPLRRLDDWLSRRLLTFPPCNQ
jgi:hypothetical protein